MRWISRGVTAAVVLALVAAAALWIRARVPTTQVGGDFRTWVLFRDGSRLQPGSPVVIAGVRIGDVTGLSIDGRLARVDLRLQRGIQLPVDSFATRRADSLFGDSYVEIIPGAGAPGDGGAANVQLIRSGEPITNVIEGGSTDTVLRAIQRALPRIDNVLASVHALLVTGRKWVNGPLEDGLADAERWLAANRVAPPLDGAARGFERLERGTAAAADALAGRAPELRRTLDRADTRLRDARAGIADARAAMAEGFAGVRGGLDGVDPVLADFVAVIEAIDHGRGDDWRGTLGRLINDPRTADAVEISTGQTAEAIHGFNRFRSWIGARLELNTLGNTARFYATAEIRARNDKFYLVELERSSRGGQPDDELVEVAPSGEYVRRQRIRDELRFTAQFGKRMGPLQLRGGLKDSTFGLGSDLLLQGGRLRFSADLFGSFQRTPRLKLAAAMAVFRSVYILAGIDDALNDSGRLSIVTGNNDIPNEYDALRYGRDVFVGAMLVFDDADLATLLRVYGALLVAML